MRVFVKTSEKKQDDSARSTRVYKKDHFIGILLERNGHGVMAIIFAFLFAIHFYILEPSNFTSFSETLRYFISALAALLAVVVSFNTLALRNQLNNMPTNMESLNRQLDKIANLIQPLREEGGGVGGKQLDNNHPALYYTHAIKSMLKATKRQAEIAVNTVQNEVDYSRQVYLDFANKIQSKLTMHDKYHSPFFLVSISTTNFVEWMKFYSHIHDDEQKEELFETAKRLHILRNIGVRIFIRNALTKLSYEMLAFTIPIIAFASIISAISNYELYNALHLRMLFAASMSTVILPFVLFFIRIMPVLQLIQGSSSIPFAQEE